MKRLLCLGLAALLLLSGTACGGPSASPRAWYDALDRLKRKENYTVYETCCGVQTVYRYDRDTAQVVSPDETLYYARIDGTCYGYAHVEEPSVWVRQAVPESENYFYAYEWIERLNKISAYIDQGLLTCTADGVYTGRDLKQTYVFRGEEHTPSSLEVRVENGDIVYLKECYGGYADEERTIWDDRKTDEVRFTDFSQTQVKLPLDVIDYEGETENDHNE